MFSSKWIGTIQYESFTFTIFSRLITVYIAVYGIGPDAYCCDRSKRLNHINYLELNKH